MLREVKISLISVVVGAFLGFGLTIGGDIWQEQRQERKENIILYRKLLEEIRYNTRKAQIMELNGVFTPYRIEEWLNFTGSPAFYRLSDDTKRCLNTYYSILRFYNEGQIKFKKLQDKAPYEFKTEYLYKLNAPFLEYLLRNNIIGVSDATPQWVIPEELKNNFKSVPK